MAERDYKEFHRDLIEVKAKIDEIFRAIGVNQLKKKLAELETESAGADFWQNRDRFTEVTQEISRIKRRIEPWEALKGAIDETAELYIMGLDEKDNSLLEELIPKISQIEVEFSRLETLELLSADEDVNNAFLSVHPGAGGTESQDWASMLLKMYIKWAEKKNFSIEVIDYTHGEEAGVKSATVLIKGEFAYGLLKSEKGVHRLVRISPFDANKRRHTSFASVEVVAEVADEIDVEILESDLKIDTYRASGAGGQHVNRTDSAVRITHIPTGLIAQCQNERSQHKNKAFAMKVLRARVYELKQKEQDERKLEKAGQKADISWGNQIRSYVFQPYTLVKDHRTDEETGNIIAVFDGEIDRLIYSYLKSLRRETG